MKRFRRSRRQPLLCITLLPAATSIMPTASVAASTDACLGLQKPAIPWGWRYSRCAIRACDAGSGNEPVVPSAFAVPVAHSARAVARAERPAPAASPAAATPAEPKKAPVARAAVESPPISATVPVAPSALAAVRAERAAPPPHQLRQHRKPYSRRRPCLPRPQRTSSRAARALPESGEAPAAPYDAAAFEARTGTEASTA